MFNDLASIITSKNMDKEPLELIPFTSSYNLFKVDQQLKDFKDGWRLIDQK